MNATNENDKHGYYHNDNSQYTIVILPTSLYKNVNGDDNDVVYSKLTNIVMTIMLGLI